MFLFSLLHDEYGLLCSSVELVLQLILLIINTLAWTSSWGKAQAKEGWTGVQSLKAARVVFILFPKPARDTK